MGIKTGKEKAPSSQEHLSNTIFTVLGAPFWYNASPKTRKSMLKNIKIVSRDVQVL